MLGVLSGLTVRAALVAPLSSSKGFAVLLYILCTQVLGDCRDLTFDECSGDAPFDTLKNIGEAACQLYCSGVYEGQCTFFIYDR